MDAVDRKDCFSLCGRGGAPDRQGARIFPKGGQEKECDLTLQQRIAKALGEDVANRTPSKYSLPHFAEFVKTERKIIV